MVELLLSISAWFMLCVFFVPLLIDLKKQGFKLIFENQAQQILYEELQSAVINAQTPESHSIFIQHTEYKISWTVTEPFVQEEVCVKVENEYINKKICGSLE